MKTVLLLVVFILSVYPAAQAGMPEVEPVWESTVDIGNAIFYIKPKFKLKGLPQEYNVPFSSLIQAQEGGFSPDGFCSLVHKNEESFGSWNGSVVNDTHQEHTFLAVDNDGTFVKIQKFKTPLIHALRCVLPEREADFSNNIVIKKEIVGDKIHVVSGTGLKFPFTIGPEEWYSAASFESEQPSTIYLSFIFNFGEVGEYPWVKQILDHICQLAGGSTAVDSIVHDEKEYVSRMFINHSFMDARGMPKTTLVCNQ